MKRLFNIGVSFFCLMASSSNIVFSQYIYWVDANFLSPSLGRSDLAGGNVTTISLASKSLPEGVALDATHNKIYFCELAYSDAKLHQTVPDLSSIAAIDTTGSVLRGIAIDPTASKIYWTTSNLSTGAKIMKANLDGTGMQTLYSFAPSSGVNLRGIAVSSTTLYWADFNSGKLQTGDSGGITPPSDYIAGLNGPVGVALGDDGYIYWIEANANTIKRRSLASGAVTTLLSGLSSPNYIAIVPTSAKMYWTEIGIPKIKMADLTGTNVQTLGITVTHPNGIAATSSPLPIQLASFNGTVQGNLVVLDWRTASEVNNYGFFIQKKQNGETDWSEVSNSFVPGHGTTNMPQHYSFTDNTAVAGVIQYRLKQVDLDGAIHFSEPIQINGVTGVAEVAPLQFALQQNYPNPFNPTTTITYALAHLAHVTLIVYNTLGEQVAQLVNEQQTSGHHNAVFNGDRLSSGVYFYRLQAGDNVATRQLLLLK